ncbi:MAG: EamA family transporter, partial [Fusobacteriaceae bacterium]
VIAIFLAIGGVIFMTIKYGKFPTYAILIAATFTVYGIYKKKVQVSSLTGLALETFAFTPVLIIYFYFIGGGALVSSSSISTKIFLVCSGIVTLVPLILFSISARITKLSSIGFFQYITPTFILLIGVFVYKEKFTVTHAITFALIWSGLILHTYSVLKKS